jgi:futalosine hydrolase
MNHQPPTLLVAAAPLEARDVAAQIERPHTQRHVFWSLIGGRLRDADVALLVTGVGAVRAAAALSAVLERAPFRRILQFGVGGAYPDSGLSIGDLALAVSECDPQTGIETPEGFCDAREIRFPLAADFPNKFPITNAWAAAAAAALPTARPVGFATVQRCSGTDALARTMASLSGAAVESMEGFPVAWLARAHNIPFAEIRVVSNTTGDRNRQRWDLPRACALATDAVLKLTESAIWRT